MFVERSFPPKISIFSRLLNVNSERAVPGLPSENILVQHSARKQEDLMHVQVRDYYRSYVIHQRILQ